jgi:hypothetical protein
MKNSDHSFFFLFSCKVFCPSNELSSSRANKTRLTRRKATCVHSFRYYDFESERRIRRAQHSTRFRWSISRWSTRTRLDSSGEREILPNDTSLQVIPTIRVCVKLNKKCASRASFVNERIERNVMTSPKVRKTISPLLIGTCV